MNSMEQAQQELFLRLPEPVRVALEADDAEALVRALQALNDEDARAVHQVVHDLGALPAQFPSTHDEGEDNSYPDSPDIELEKVDDLPDAPVPLFQVVDGQRIRPTQDWVDAGHRAQSVGSQGSVLYPVWYATTRKPKKESRPSLGFSGDPDPQGRVHHGIARVFVPESHEPGSLGTFWLKRWLWFSQNDRLVLRRIEGRTEQEFWTEFRVELKQLRYTLDGDPAPGNDVLLFVHGFCVSFTAAMVRAAQLGYDMAMPGLTACFSWPSRGSKWGYSPDEAECEANAPALADFIRGLAAAAGPGRIHILAHSMGNRVVLRAIELLAVEARMNKTPNEQLPLGHILLAAADVHRKTFLLLAPGCKEVSRGQTNLYISTKDRAIWASRIRHYYPRAGLRPPVTIFPGVNTVDVNSADINLDLFHHTYYGDCKKVIYDMGKIIHFNASPGDARRNLQPAGDGKYWQFD